jgi:hypothetical protein
MKDEGGRMNEGQESYSRHIRRGRAFANHLPVSIRHFLFSLSDPFSLILHPSAFILS